MTVCPKCCNKLISVQYFDERWFVGLLVAECLTYTCNTCGYKQKEQCKDVALPEEGGSFVTNQNELPERFESKVKGILLQVDAQNDNYLVGSKRICDLMLKELQLARQEGEKRASERVRSKVGQLRQWLNEKPKKMLVKNEQIEMWLELEALQTEGKV